jgi:hypothetical protein
MKTYDIVKEATTQVENQLQLLQALYLATQTLDEGRSRRVCRCGSCKNHRVITLAWLSGMLGEAAGEVTEAGQPAAAVAAKSDASLPTDLG